MPKKAFRVAMMFDLEFPLKRHADVFAGAYEYAEAHGWDAIIDEFADESLGEEPGYDGVIARATRELHRKASRLDVPVVNVWLSSPVADHLPGVFADWEAYGRMAAEHLIERGFRRFAAILTRTNQKDVIAVKAFRDAVAEVGGTVISTEVGKSSTETRGDWHAVKQAMVALMNQWKPPVGVLAAREDTGRILAQMCRTRGWRVPQDVGIVAGENEGEICIHPKPSLTSIELGHRRIGYEAARMLDRLMSAGRVRRKSRQANGHLDRIVVPPERLVVRESTDFHLVSDSTVVAAMAFITGNCHKPIGPADVARAVATHPRTLTNRFHEHLGRTIAQEILRVRLERAKRDLAEGDRSIKAIALMAGFSSRLRLYDAFMREFGMTPSDYRKTCRFEATHPR